VRVTGLTGAPIDSPLGIVERAPPLGPSPPASRNFSRLLLLPRQATTDTAGGPKETGKVGCNPRVTFDDKVRNLGLRAKVRTSNSIPLYLRTTAPTPLRQTKVLAQLQAPCVLL
jgi:hypothetical protein